MLNVITEAGKCLVWDWAAAIPYSISCDNDHSSELPDINIVSLPT